MRIKLHSGTWSNASAIVLSGGGAVTTANATQPGAFYFGVAGLVVGLVLLLWGITVDGEHWWKRDRIRMTWPYALMLVSAIGFAIGAVAAFRTPTTIASTVKDRKQAQIAKSDATAIAPLPSPSPTSYASPAARAFHKNLDDFVGQIAKPEPVQTHSVDRQGDTYNVSASGNGTAIGRVDTYVDRKPPYQMNVFDMEKAWQAVQAADKVIVISVGSQSDAAADELQAYLKDKGMNATVATIGSASWADRLTKPITPNFAGGPASLVMLGGARIAVDVTK